MGYYDPVLFPSVPQRDLRDLTRHRSNFLRERVNLVNRVQKVLACIIHESRVKTPKTITRYKLQRLDLNNSLFCLSVTGLNERK